MKTSKTLLGLALGVVAASPAFALTESTSYFYPVEGTTTLDFPANLTIAVSQFNTSGGTRVLDSIDFSATYSGNSQIKFENVGGGTGTVTLSSRSVAFQLQKVGGSGLLSEPNLLLDLSKPLTGFSFTYTSYDGTTDYGGTSGSSSSVEAYTKSGSNSFSDAPTKATFTGASTVLLPLLNQVGYAVFGGGSSDIITPTTGSASFTVTYNYSTTIPEPRVYGAIGAVACLGLLGYRRLRAPQAAQA